MRRAEPLRGRVGQRGERCYGVRCGLGIEDVAGEVNADVMTAKCLFC